MLPLFGQSINGPAFPVYVGGVPYDKSSERGKSYPVKHLLGGRAQRFEVRSGDHGYAGDAANGNERAELVTYRAGAGSGEYGPVANFGEDYWLSFAFMVAPGDPVLFPGSETTRNGCCGQMHDMQDPGDTVGLSPPFLFQIDPGTDTIVRRVRTRFDKAAQQTAPNYMNFTDHSAIPQARGQWVRNVCRLRFGVEDDAQLEVWQDGVKIVEELSGFNMGYGSTVSDPRAAYWQYGVYRTANENTLVVYYANMEQGLASLADRITDPLPIPAI